MSIWPTVTAARGSYDLARSFLAGRPSPRRGGSDWISSPAMDGRGERRRRGHGWPPPTPAMDGRRRRAAQQPPEQAEHDGERRAGCPEPPASAAPAMDGGENRGAMDGDRDRASTASSALTARKPRRAWSGRQRRRASLDGTRGASRWLNEVCCLFAVPCRLWPAASRTVSFLGSVSKTRILAARR